MTVARLEQHLDSRFAARVLYAPGRIAEARVATGVRLAYAIHTWEAQDVTDPMSGLESERVVLLTGYCSRQEECAPLVDALLTRWRRTDEENEAEPRLEVLTLDNRGVGHSDAPWGAYSTSQMASDVLALADFVGWPTFHLVGASMGGMICQKAALLAPERIRSLALVATARGTIVPGPSSWPAVFKMSTSAFSPDRMVAGILSFLYPSAFLDTRIGDGKTMRDVMARYHSTVSVPNGSPPITGSLGQTAAVTTHHVTDAKLRRLRDHGFPILVLGARLDQCISVEHVLKLGELLASDHTELFVFDDAGHGLMLQHMDATADKLLALFHRASAA